ncbi:hypothetical protein Pmani_022270 [Petrolisthes manimaculis]|uniref:Uncharacterized protein n=1 Tax=Petrolisthes manimaculis TaxID=1843537 RepID=A0AAE1PEC7_9EUCA|nr:hypothetical protein Pmani_022270 [Petrolisthes manimaculis]
MADEPQHHTATSSPVLIHTPPSSTLTSPPSILFSIFPPPVLHFVHTVPCPPLHRSLHHLVSYSTTLLFSSPPLLHLIPPPSHPHLRHLVPSTSSPSPSHLLLLHLSPSVLICGLSVEGAELITSTSTPQAAHRWLHLR